MKSVKLDVVRDLYFLLSILKEYGQINLSL